MSETKSYPITPEKLAAIQQKLTAAGMTFTLPSGKLFGEGVEVDYTVTDSAISVTLVNDGNHAHWLVWHKVNSWLE